jgi:hypothetical protein
MLDNPIISEYEIESDLIEVEIDIEGSPKNSPDRPQSSRNVMDAHWPPKGPLKSQEKSPYNIFSKDPKGEPKIVGNENLESIHESPKNVLDKDDKDLVQSTPAQKFNSSNMQKENFQVLNQPLSGETLPRDKPVIGK